MKEKILEKSTELFSQSGFTETSIQDIVEGIGVTKGTFYYYYKSKEELLMDIHLRFINDILGKQQKIMEDKNTNFKEKLYEIVFMLMRNIETQGQSARVFFREIQNLSKDHLSHIFAKRHEFRINIEKLIENGKEKGEFRKELQTGIVTLAILGMCNWSYHWFDPSGPLTDEAVAKIYIDLILNGAKA